MWAYDTAAGTLGTIYDRAAAGADAPLSGVDNLTVSRAGEIFVCEDGGNMEICVIEPDGTVAPFLRLTGEAAVGLPSLGNELSGVVFSPSGDRMYFAAQRAFGFGAVYEVTGPFRAATGARRRSRERRSRAICPTPGIRPACACACRRRISLAALRRRGLLVEVRLDAPAALRVALRTDDLRRVPGRRGSTERPHTVTLDRRRIGAARAGRRRLRLRVSAAEARRLRRARAPVTLQVAVSARGAGRRHARGVAPPAAALSSASSASTTPSARSSAASVAAVVDVLRRVVLLVRARADPALVQARDADARHARGRAPRRARWADRGRARRRRARRRRAPAGAAPSTPAVRRRTARARAARRDRRAAPRGAGGRRSRAGIAWPAPASSSAGVIIRGGSRASSSSSAIATATPDALSFAPGAQSDSATSAAADERDQQHDRRHELHGAEPAGVDARDARRRGRRDGGAAGGERPLRQPPQRARQRSLSTSPRFGAS